MFLIIYYYTVKKYINSLKLIRIFDTRNSDYTTVLISDYTENELLE